MKPGPKPRPIPERSCVGCGTSLQLSRPGDPKRFCSPACSNRTLRKHAASWRTTGRKRCPECGETKDLTTFSWVSTYERPHSYCKPCAIKRSAADYVANKDRHRVTKRRSKLRTYGLTPEDYEAMRTDQDGLCAMCGSPPSAENLDVDHCHETGAVRGLLCNRCNRVIGQAGDDPALLELGIKYLEAHRAVE